MTEGAFTDHNVTNAQLRAFADPIISRCPACPFIGFADRDKPCRVCGRLNAVAGYWGFARTVFQARESYRQRVALGILAGGEQQPLKPTTGITIT